MQPLNRADITQAQLKANSSAIAKWCVCSQCHSTESNSFMICFDNSNQMVLSCCVHQYTTMALLRKQSNFNTKMPSTANTLTIHNFQFIRTVHVYFDCHFNTHTHARTRSEYSIIIFKKKRIFQKILLRTIDLLYLTQCILSMIKVLSSFSMSVFFSYCPFHLMYHG